MIEIRYVENNDKGFWLSLDKHMREEEFVNKVYAKQGYVLLKDNHPIGLLRFNLFWDSIPFCNMLIIDKHHQKEGYGKMLIRFWEEDMKSEGYNMIMTSTRVDEEAQHFFRLLGYKDCGGFIMDISGFEQPMELLMNKKL